MEKRYFTQSVPCNLRHHMTINYKSQSRLMVVLSIFSGKYYMSRNNSRMFTFVCTTVLYVLCNQRRRWRNNMCFSKGVLRS